MFDIGGGELLLIIFVVLMLFGPKKIPEIARSLGKGMSYLRRAQTELQRNINAVSADIEHAAGIKEERRPFRPQPNPLPPAADGETGTTEADASQTTQKEQPRMEIRPADGTLAREAERKQPPPQTPNADTSAADA